MSKQKDNDPKNYEARELWLSIESTREDKTEQPDIKDEENEDATDDEKEG